MDPVPIHFQSDSVERALDCFGSVCGLYICAHHNAYVVLEIHELETLATRIQVHVNSEYYNINKVPDAVCNPNIN